MPHPGPRGQKLSAPDRRAGAGFVTKALNLGATLGFQTAEPLNLMRNPGSGNQRTQVRPVT